VVHGLFPGMQYGHRVSGLQVRNGICHRRFQTNATKTNSEKTSELTKKNKVFAASGGEKRQPRVHARQGEGTPLKLKEVSKEMGDPHRRKSSRTVGPLILETCKTRNKIEI